MIINQSNFVTRVLVNITQVFAESINRVIAIELQSVIHVFLTIVFNVTSILSTDREVMLIKVHRLAMIAGTQIKKTHVRMTVNKQ